MKAIIYIGYLLLLGLPFSNAQQAMREKIKDSGGKRYFESYNLDNTAECLKTMEEPSLWTRDADDKSIHLRWTWLRTFHEPVCMRVTKTPGKPAELVATTLSGKGGYDLGGIQSRKVIHLSDSNWKNLQDWVSEKDFWAPLSSAEKAMMGGLDGATWDFELSTPGRYEILSLWTPSVLTDPASRSYQRYVTLGRLLLRMGDMSVQDADFY